MSYTNTKLGYSQTFEYSEDSPGVYVFDRTLPEILSHKRNGLVCPSDGRPPMFGAMVMKPQHGMFSHPYFHLKQAPMMGFNCQAGCNTNPGCHCNLYEIPFKDEVKYATLPQLFPEYKRNSTIFVD